MGRRMYGQARKLMKTWKQWLSTAALCVAAGCATQTTEQLGGARSKTLSATDNDYFRDITLSNLTEIQTSQMALQTSTNGQVKEFAEHMLADHGSAGSQVKAVATAKGVTLPSMLDAAHAKMVQSLQGKTGADFDRAYLDLQVVAHQAAVNLDEVEANNGNDPEVKSLANALLPVLRGHLTKAKQVKDAMMPSN